MKNLILIFLSFLFTPNNNDTPPLRALFIGDSLTCYANGWQQQLSEKYDYQYTNISSGGKRTLWMVNTLTNHLNKDDNYSNVFIYGGCNDAFSYVDLQSTVNNIQKMVDLCNSRRIKPYVIIGYNPAKVILKTPYSNEITKRSRERYIELQKLMNGLRNCVIIPMDTTVTYSDSEDGVHLKGSGHRKFGNWVINKMK